MTEFDILFAKMMMVLSTESVEAMLNEDLAPILRHIVERELDFRHSANVARIRASADHSQRVTPVEAPRM